MPWWGVILVCAGFFIAGGLGGFALMAAGMTALINRLWRE